MAKQAKRSGAFWDGLNAVDPRDTSAAYMAEYEQGAAARAAAHARLDKVCADARRMTENDRERMRKAPPVRAVFMGESREFIKPAAMAQN